MKGTRLDVYLCESNECQSREIAKRLIMAGKVLVNEIIASKSSQIIKEKDKVRVKEKLKYVSRGGLKLEKALVEFDVDVKALTVLDVGASTGGFTDCLLINGAANVVAVDVGYGQLSWKLRNDDRVKVLERTNARYLTPSDIGGICNGAVCDASFISLTKLLPAIGVCTNSKAFFIGLIKPQFEAGKDKIGKGGIVRDKKIHIETINNVITYLNNDTDFNVVDLAYSPITGPKGNIEFLIYCLKNVEQKSIDIAQTVDNAHIELKRIKN